MAGNIIELHTEVPAELEANVFGQFDAVSYTHLTLPTNREV